MEKNMLTVYKTDERMFHLAKQLANLSFKVPTHVYAPNIVIDLPTIQKVEQNATIFCGRYTDDAFEYAKGKNIAIKSYVKDEKFQAINSKLTAEGTLMVMIEHCVKSIFDCNVLVLGFGRTGSAVVNVLNRLDIPVDVATTSSIRPAHAFARNILPMSDFDFKPYDVVVNTVPLPIVKDSQLMTMRPSTVYIDLASTPAINLEYAKYLGIDADIYPALPAKTCPYSSANAIYKYIVEMTK